jgi:hypothetical protein
VVSLEFLSIGCGKADWGGGNRQEQAGVENRRQFFCSLFSKLLPPEHLVSDEHDASNGLEERVGARSRKVISFPYTP